MARVVEVAPRADPIAVEVESGERPRITGGVLSLQMGEGLIARLTGICPTHGALDVECRLVGHGCLLDDVTVGRHTSGETTGRMTE